jgi:hypothetical protein
MQSKREVLALGGQPGLSLYADFSGRKFVGSDGAIRVS